MPGMDSATPPPPIPERHRQHGRRQSVPATAPHPKSNDANRVQVQPASPEVISSLITSLSIISSPANELFEQSDGFSSLFSSPSASYFSASGLDRHTYNRGPVEGGSFGIDYGAFKQPSLEDVQDDGPLDELAASPPVVRTAKPPSGFSPLTAPKSPAKDGGIKTFLRGSSRPSSNGSNGSREHDEVSSIGSLSIEPGFAPQAELRKRRSSDSWGKKQGRNSKGIMYMSSKERLRETERKRASVAAVGGAKGLGIDRVPALQPDVDTFLAGRPISEETNIDQTDPSVATATTTTVATSPNFGSISPALSGKSQGGISSPRPIPTRDSSLRTSSTKDPSLRTSTNKDSPLRNSSSSNKDSSMRSSSTNKDSSLRNSLSTNKDASLRSSSMNKRRSSNRSSQHSGKQHENGDHVIREVDEQDDLRRERHTEKRRLDRMDSSADSTSKLHQPLRSHPALEPLKASTLASKQVAESAKVEQRLIAGDDTEEGGAPSPAIAQRKSRTSSDHFESSSGKNKISGRNTPEVLDGKPSKRDSRLKSLSAPISPTGSSNEGYQKSVSQPLSRKDATSPEPIKPQMALDDRPTSADSIDGAVESYLCSPRLSQKIRHPQTARTISFSEVGDPEGHAVFCCVGMGLTRYITAFYDELALTLKLRLITPDRPGVGDSEAYTDGTATPLSWPDDVYAICQALKITKFSILAHSAGAIYALATALRMPQHIRGRIHLLAPWIPPSQMNVAGAQQVSPPTNSMPTSQRILRALPTPILKAANSSFMSATSTSITSSLPKSPRRTKRKSPNGRETPLGGRRTVTPGPEKENQGPNSTIYPKPSAPNGFDRAATIPLDPNSEAAILAAAASTLAEKERQTTYDTRLTHAIWELATSNANPAVDLLVCLERRHTIGFRYVDINRAVVIHHGSKDTRVPVENVKWLGKMMRRCEVRILEGEGHGLMASAGVMGGVLMEIAKEWEDWMRVVQQKPADGSRTRILRERASIGAFR